MTPARGGARSAAGPNRCWYLARTMADQATDPAAPPPRRGRRWLFAVATALVFAGVLELAARLALPRASLPVLIEPLKNDDGS